MPIYGIGCFKHQIAKLQFPAVVSSPKFVEKQGSAYNFGLNKSRSLNLLRPLQIATDFIDEKYRELLFAWVTTKMEGSQQAEAPQRVECRVPQRPPSLSRIWSQKLSWEISRTPCSQQTGAPQVVESGVARGEITEGVVVYPF